MATSKHYAYYLEGNQLALIEKDVSFDNDVDSKDYGPGASRQRWESPKTTVADGLEIKYTYALDYTINRQVTDLTITGYNNNASGYLRLIDATASYTDFDSNNDVGDYFVLTNAGKWNGLHKITAFETAGSSNNVIVTDTKVPVESITAGTSYIDFEETPKMFYDVTVISDESFNIELPSYLSKALVYYMKAKLAEDALNVEAREYLMREFKKMIEKYENSRISGLRIMSPGSHAIR